MNILENKRKNFCLLLVLIFWSLNSTSHAVTDSPGFKIFIWPYQTDVLTDYDVYRDLGLSGFQIDRGAGQHQRIRLSIEKDFPYYAGHVADKGYLYLKNNHKDRITGKNSLLERPFSLGDPKVIKQIKAHILKNISDLKNGNVIAYALDDEISLGTFVNPSDVDVSSVSLEWFRKWLKEEYITIEALNRQWDTDFKSFSGVFPQGFEQVRKNLSNKRFSGWNLSPWMDFRQFMDFQFSTVLSELVEYANTIDPVTPVGFVGGQAPSAWGGYDYGRLTRAVQWMEAYDIHGTNEILRSFWRDPKRLKMRTFFSSNNVKIDSWFLWYNLLHGVQAVIAWPEGWFETIDGKRQPSDHIQSLKKIFKTVQGEISNSIVNRNSLFSADPIGIYYSHPSVQAGWAMDALVHGKTWPKRLSSIDNENQSSGVLRKVWCKTLEDLGFQYDFINYLDVKESKINLNQQFKLIILPKTICLSQKEADVFRQFVENGGVLVADYVCGIFDGHGRWRKTGLLDDMFGIQRKDTAGYLNGKGITEINAERYKAPFNERFSYYNGAFEYKRMVIFERGTKKRDNQMRKNNNGPDVVIKNNYKKGSTYYLNLSPIKYWGSQNRFSGFGENWRMMISTILESAGLKPRVSVLAADGSKMMESLFWQNGETIYLGIIKNPSDNFEQINGEPTKITLSFNKEVLLKNLRSKREFQRKKVFEDIFSPWEGNLYEVNFQDANN
ncbi:alpha-amylase family protein [Desulfobacula sp.]|uniref:alpha-amylase family protein n=1 Tax=Desulfobacula sp. TaxID=2593537 RepID=UPI002606333F|nr:alpha-amylase family protein [Desulfobacula sp.]